MTNVLFLSILSLSLLTTSGHQISILPFLKIGSVSSSVLPQEKEGKVLKAPKNWGIEQIKFPLSYAPSIKFTGFEHGRFPPGFAKSDSPEYWCCKFAWEINEDPKLTEERLTKLAETYFDGLSKAVAGGKVKKLQKPVAIFIRDGSGFKGRLRLFDAFSTKTWINVNTKVKSIKYGKKHLVIFEMSPKHFDQQIWKKFQSVKVIPPKINRNSNASNQSK